MMDNLVTIMEKQRELQTRLGTNFATMSDEGRAQFMRDHRGYMEDEIAEALYEMPNYKMWKDYSSMSPEARAVAWQKVRMELVDALHFFVNLLLCAGFTADELCQMYLAKNKENHARQDAGYTHDVSYREQAVGDVVKAHCTVNTGEHTVSADTYIAMLKDDDGIHLMMNTDTVQIGILANILSDVYYNDLHAMTTEQSAPIDEEVKNAVAAYWEARDNEQN